MKRVLLVTLVLLTGCASDQHRVQDAAAIYTWYEWRYERECFVPNEPKDCSARYKALKDLKATSEIANTVQKIGKLPEDAKKHLKAATEGVK